MTKNWSRRDFIKAGIYTGAAGLMVPDLLSCIGQPSTSAKPTKGGTLIFGEASGPLALDPLGTNSSGAAFGFYYQIWDALVRRDDNHNFVPGLATSWKTLDSNTWEFTLRTGVTFHNGEPFDANAVKFTADRILSGKYNSSQAATLAPVIGVDVVDAATVRFRTKNPLPTMLFVLFQVFIIAPKYTTDQPDKALTSPIGTGPFKFVGWTAGDRMTLKANDSYWGGRPNIDYLIMRIIPDASARLAALEAGDIHIDDNVPLDSVDAVAKLPNLRIAGANTDAALIIEFNTIEGGPLANPQVRQALNYAVDKETISKSLLVGKLRPLQGQLITAGALGFNPDVKEFPYDPTKAKQLLTQAGYANGFDMTLSGPAGHYPSDKEIMLAVAAQLAQVGVRANVVPLDTGVWLTTMGASKFHGAFLVSWANFGDAGYAALRLSDFSSLGVYYHDPTYDQLTTAGTQTLDPKQRQTTYNQLAQYMHDQALALFLFQGAVYFGISSKVTGFTARFDEMPFFYNTSLSS